MKRKGLYFMITCMLSVSILSGCSDNSTIGTQGMTAPAPIAATKDPDQIYKDESLEIMQDMSANKELFENCTDEKIREKYEKISYDAGYLTMQIQRELLDKKELKKARKQMKQYDKQYKKLLKKVNATEGN